MSWQKAARGVAAVVGLGTAVAIYALTRERPVSDRPQVSTLVDPTAEMGSGPGRDLRYQGNTLIGDLEYAGVEKYADGRSELQKVKYTLKNGTVISADRVTARGTTASGQPAEFALTGHVHVEGPDRMTLQGDTATFSETTGIAAVPGAASFSRGRISGTGTGGVYERDTGIFKLLADVKVQITAEDPAQTPIDATSQVMTFTQSTKSMLFDQNARIARAAETLSGDRATLYLSDDEQRFRLIELRGNSRVAPAPGKVSDMPDMQAEDIDLGFYDGSAALQRASLQRRAVMVMANEQGRRSIDAPQIQFTTAPDGKTLTRLEGGEPVTVKTPASAGSPERMITASTLAATGSDKSGLTQARFNGRVEFVEIVPAGRGGPATKRTGTSQTLLLDIKGQLDAIDLARFERNVKFVSGNVTGEADVGIYRAAKGELDLQPLTGSARRPHANDTTVDVDAAEIITVDLNTNNLFARRDVKTVRLGKPAGQSSPSAGMFDDTGTVLGFSSEFRYDAAAKQAKYVGAPSVRARLLQNDSEVTGDEVELFQEKQDLNATGHVESTFLMAAGPGHGGPGAPVKYRVTANSLVYTEATRTATYVGSPATLRSADGETVADTLVLILAKTSRTLDRLEATGNVHTSLQGGREAQGRTLVYDAAKETYILQGEPLTLISKDTDGTCSMQTGNYMVFSNAVGAPEFPASRNQTAPIRSNQPCPASLTGKSPVKK